MRVSMRPIGRPAAEFQSEDEVQANRDAVAPRRQQLAESRARVADGWGQKYRDRVHEAGKLTTAERLERLRDPGTELLPVCTFVNFGQRFGERELECPGAGVVTAFARVHGRWTMVIANDNTVASGAWWPRTPEKIERAQEMALRLGLPVVYLVDCSGLFLPEQGRTFAGATGAGHIFKKNSLLSAAGVPQIAGVFGDCIAGGGYMPIISDRVIMTENAYMVIAAAALIKGAKSQHITSHSIGGPDIHVHASACADERAPDDDVAITMIRGEIARLPSSAADYYRAGVAPAPPRFPASEIASLLPGNPQLAYDVYEILARLVDDSLFWEVMPHVGREVVTGIARIGGLYCGLLANQPGLFDHPQCDGQKRSGGILYREGIAKLSEFSRSCESDGIPLVWLQDIAGFDIGAEAERLGLLGLGSNLIYTNSTNRTPMITVLLRKASGAGYYAMAGLPYDPVLQISSPVARLAVMDGRTAAIASYNSQLDDEFEIPADTPPDRAQKIRDGMAAVQAKLTDDMDPLVSAARMDTDEVVDFDEIRTYLEAAVEMAYQGTGRRRVKNPRIWSMHDLSVLGESLETVGASVSAPDEDAATPFLVDAADIPGGKALTAPIAGTFYRAAGPGSPPFVEVGAEVEPGTTLCIIEAMKVMNQVRLRDVAPGVSRARVVSLPLADGQPVAVGHTLFIVSTRDGAV